MGRKKTTVEEAPREPRGPGSAPKTPDELHAWLREHIGIDVPREPVLDGHAAPFDYLVHTFFEGRGQARKDDPVPPIVPSRSVSAESTAPAEVSEASSGPGTDHEDVGTDHEDIIGGAEGVIGHTEDLLGGAKRLPIDCVVWANRGGGKTFLGAVATMLDLVFKHGIEIRILGGSMEQSKRMHAYLRGLFRRESLAGLVKGRITEKRLRLENGSEVELLAQSHASVRGTRVQKLRCDEVELFDPAVWEAAQLVTRSRQCGSFWVRGAVECLSTLHIPHGVMFKIVQEAAEGKRRLFRWGVVDVLEACGSERSCRAGEGGANGQMANCQMVNEGAPGAGRVVSLPQIPDGQHVRFGNLPFGNLPARPDCPLLPECRGHAKARAGNLTGVGIGHIAIDDAIAMKSRVSLATWEAEMLCLRPARTDAVLPEFDTRVHVVDALPWEGEGDGTGATGPGAPCEKRTRDGGGLVWYGGMDFGTRSPTVILWGAVDAEGVLWIVDERSVKGELLAQHIEAIKARAWPRLRWLGVDPAGGAKNEQTGRSNIDVLRAAGLGVKAAKAGVTAGLELIRARLKPASSTPVAAVESAESSNLTAAPAMAPAAVTGPRLFVHRRCAVLIESLEKYHFPSDPNDEVKPVKDGSDHAVDALRYLVLNLDRPKGEFKFGSY